MKFLKWLMLFFFLILLVNGFALTQNWNGKTGDLNTGTSNWYGYKFKAINDVNLVTVTTFTGVDANTLILKDSNCVSLVTATSLDTNFLVGYVLNAGETYYVEVGKPNSVNWTLHYDNTVTYPIISADINWVSGNDFGVDGTTCGANSSTQTLAIKYIYTDEEIQESTYININSFTLDNNVSGRILNNTSYTFDFNVTSDFNYLHSKIYYSTTQGAEQNLIIDLDLNDSINKFEPEVTVSSENINTIKSFGNDLYILIPTGEILKWNGSTTTSSGVLGSNFRVLEVFDGNLFACDSVGKCITTNNGSDWSTSLQINSTIIYSIIASDTNLFIGTNDGNVFTFDGTTWSHSGLIGNSIRQLGYADGNVYSGNSTGEIKTHKDGIWTSLGDKGTIPYAMTSCDGNFLIAFSDGKIQNYDGTYWSELIDLGVFILAMTEFDGNVFISTNDGSVYTYDCDSIISNLGSQGNKINTSTQLNEFLYFGKDGGEIQSYHRELINCDSNSLNFLNGVSCSYEWTTPTLSTGYYYFDLNIMDFNSNIFDFNSTEIFRVGYDTIYPTMDYNLNINTGFVDAFDVNANLICYDDFNTLIQYDINLNTLTSLLNTTDYNSNLQTINTDINIGKNTFTFSCTDLAGNKTTNSIDVYGLLFRLIDEDTGDQLIDLNRLDISEGLAYTYDGNYSYNFYDTNTIEKKFIDFENVIRFDFTYADALSTRINREIDFDLLNDYNVGICVAELQTLHEILIKSSSIKDIGLYNPFARCWNLASSTKFAYLNGKMVKAYTINKPYYLYYYNNGVKTTLATIDGLTANEINIDTLQFNDTEYSISITQDTLVIQPKINAITKEFDTNVLTIYYNSLVEENASVRLKIYDVNTNALVFDYTEEDEPNEFLIYFYFRDYNFSNDDMMKIILTINKEDGTTETSTNYFSLLGIQYSNIIDPSIAVIVAFLLFLVGITMFSYRYAMGWIGLILGIFAIGILSLAPGFWWIRFAQGIMLILIVFVGLIMKNETMGVN